MRGNRLWLSVLIGSEDACMCVSSLCLSLCPMSWVKGAFRGAGELFKSCVWVLVCVSASVGGAGGQIYAPCTGEMKAISQAGHSSLFFPVSPARLSWLASVQFNFFRAHGPVLSPPHPFLSPPPTKSPLSYSLPLQLPRRLSAKSACPQSAVSLSSPCPLSPAAEVSNLSERQSLGPALPRLLCCLSSITQPFSSPTFLRKLDGSHKLIPLWGARCFCCFFRVVSG